MTDLPLRCTCGKLHGTLADVSATAGSRLVCYCGDCQAFARFLGRTEVLDNWGGTDIFHIAPAQVRFESDDNALACVRLSEKGLHRFYCAHCKSPVANAMSAKLALVGLISSFIDPRALDGKSLDDVIGPPRAHLQQKRALNGGPPFPDRGLRLIARSMRKAAKWTLQGKGRPTPFWDASGHPTAVPRILTPEERSAL